MLRCKQEMQRPGKLKQWWQQLTILTFLDFHKPYLSIEHATSWSDVDQQVDEYGDDDEEHYEVDVECHIGDDDELVESAYTVGLMTDDPELLEQFDGHVEGADASALYASASRSFQEARELLSRVESASGYSLFVGIGASDGLQACKVSWQRQEGQRTLETLLSTMVESLQTLVLGVLPKTPTLRTEISSADVQEASDRNWHNSWCTTPRSSASS